jgi:hypothetical protein
MGKALEALKEKIQDWKYQSERVAEWETPVIIASSLAREGEKQVYVLKGYVHITASDNWAAGLRMETPSVGIALFMIWVDPENGEALAVKHIERCWEPNFRPSTVEFDREWDARSDKDSMP